MDDYLLGEVLHAGMETRVVAGVLRSTGIGVAIKLPYEEPPSARTLEKLRHEHALLSELVVPGVIHCHGLMPHGAGVALVLERWGAESLDQLLLRGPLPIEPALRLGAALARALRRVHRKGIIHRDVKPQNVLVDAELHDVRLIDFGIATRRRAHVADEAPIEALAGTLAYMAPEQTGRMRRTVDARADMYGLGATLYQMLTGTLPFETADAMELIHAHIARTPEAPHRRAPSRGIPEAVSAVVLKLMEKSPERRYQTAEGVASDLEQAACAWSETSAVQPFVLGARDWEDRIRKPSRLFGREREITALGIGLERACRGEAVMALVAGPSGVGKSALVNALRGEVRARAGVFAPGKLDQFRRGNAHEALAQALRSVVRRRLAGAAGELSRWQAAWQQAAGPNARILVDLMPELRHVLGEPPPLAELGPAEARARYTTTIQRFVQASTAPENPLVLFLDDLQWADAQSLALLEQLVTATDAAHLYVIGAYRDEEVDATHALHALVAAAGACARGLATITLGPLDDRAADAMIEDMLDRPASELAALSSLVKVKTDGSPFFVEQYLQALHERGLLVRDLQTGAWRWDAEQIERGEVTDNVATLLSAKIGALPAFCRRVLHLGACIGPIFDAELLHETLESGTPAPRDALDELQQEGLIVPAGDGEASAAWAFVHDRVQQAAYESFDDGDRARAHLLLARAMERRGAAEGRDDELFAMLQQWRSALPLIDGAEEAHRVARMLLRGGGRAKAASAYDLAAALLGAARGLLGEHGWNEDFALMFDTELALAEADWLAGRPEASTPRFEECMARAPDLSHEARTAIVWAPLLFLAGRYAQGLTMALRILAGMGHAFPGEPQDQQRFIGELVGRIAPRLATTTLEAWRALPRCTDPVEILTAELLGTARLLAGGIQPTLQICIVFTIVEHTFTHGISSATPSAMSMATICLVGALQLVDLGAKCADIVLDLLRAPGIAKAAPMFEVALAAQFVLPRGALLEHWRAVPEICMREGSVLYEEFALSAGPLMSLLVGQPVDSCAVPERTWRIAMCGELAGVSKPLREALEGSTDSDAMTAIARVASVPATAPTTQGIKLATAAFAALHLGEDAEALRLATEAEPLWMAMYCSAPDIELQQILAYLGPAAVGLEGEQAQALTRKVAFHRGRIDKLATLNPTTFRHMKLLADASEARAAGRHEAAQQLYEEAIEDAQRNHFINGEALGSRFAGEHACERGLRRAGSAYLRGACDAYIRWGAHGAAARLRTRHPGLFPDGPRDEPLRHLTVTTTSVTTIEGNSLDRRLDVTSIVRAAQALSGDIVIDSLIERMLRVLAENAGAERAALALSRAGGLRVRAELSLEPAGLETNLDEPVEGSARLPAALVQYVARSREPIVLREAGTDPRFDDDPYLRARRPASVLAVPLLHQGRLSGVMYLEHPRVAGAFPEARIATVSLLAAQAATAVENATLYAELQAYSGQLERQVKERTAELDAARCAADAANQAKSDFLASMSHELRTPLNGILGYAQILDRSSSLSPQERESLRVIRRSGEHLLALINDVLDLARIEAGKLELSPRAIELPRLLRTVAGMCSVRADQKRISFTHELTGTPPPALWVDEKRLIQVLLNLTGNAVKFTERGSVRLIASVEDTEASPGGERTVRFRVEDTGPGIAPAHLRRIFEPFVQVGEDDARAAGTGLGLSITRRIVERMGGLIEVQSELGHGTAFVVTLRLPEAITGVTASKPSWDEIAGYQGERLTALIVDDNPDNRAVFHDMLSPIGFEVLEADGGARALDMAAAHRPAFVLMDVAMPDMDGYEATRRLRELAGFERLVIIATSASVSEQERGKSASAGCDDFLPKPIRADDLFGILQRHLGLTWTLRQAIVPPAPPPEAAMSHRPPDDVIAGLAQLASKGRIRGVLQEAQRLGEQDGRLEPWLRQLRDIARQFQLSALQDFLRESRRG